MAARLIAGLILLVGIGALAPVLFGSSDDASDVADVVAADAPAEPDDAEPEDPQIDGGTAPTDDTASSADIEEAATTTAAPLVEIDLENFGPRKDLVELDGWLNTDITSLDDLDGKVVVVEMWTFGCFNCKARIPHNQELYASHSRDDFEIVGVHAPEFAYEAEVPNIEEAVDRLGITWPVALDTEKKNFRGWQDGGRRFWPRTYVIDQNGDVRFDHIGEGKYDELSDLVAHLIDNPPEPTA